MSKPTPSSIRMWNPLLTWISLSTLKMRSTANTTPSSRSLPILDPRGVVEVYRLSVYVRPAERVVSSCMYSSRPSNPNPSLADGNSGTSTSKVTFRGGKSKSSASRPSASFLATPET